MLNRTLIAALAALSIAPRASAGDWTERYFGVGSAGDRGEACELARDHAQGNSFKACVERRGKRGEASYTDCICTSASESLQVCNVNLKVSCDGPLSGSDPASQQKGARPVQAGRRVDGAPRRAHPARQGPHVRPAH
jgi:hypothetical protein